MTAKERAALQRWKRLKQDISNSTDIDPLLTAAEKERMRVDLEKDTVQWIKYIFPKAAKYEFADFQIKAIERLIDNDEWYEVLSWSRELAKSTIVMFVVMNRVLTGKKKNVLLASSSEKNAIRLLAPYRAHLEANRRIIALYGEQQSVGDWTESEFVTRGGAAFRALGAGSPPRGSRNEEIRPDIILMDDFDTDEECRNPEVLKKKWEWFEHALYPTRSISEPTWVIWCGNIIAQDCCIVRAGAMADHHDIINIRMVDIRKPNPTADMAHGKSVWPQKNSEANIDRALSKIGTKAIYGEYFNNPISEGDVFGEPTWDKVPPLKSFRFLVAYGDPAPSEKLSKQSSTKAVWLCGWYKNNLYVITGRLDRGLNADFINWYFDLNEYVGGRTTVYNYVENNSLQDPFYQQVFKPLLAKICKQKNRILSILADSDAKTDKATRIEANLDPLWREGRIILNEAEQNNPHMKRLAEQFQLFTLTLKSPADGPDCVEGALRKIKQKIGQLAPPVVVTTADLRKLNKNRI